MSQRILINQQDAVEKYSSDTLTSVHIRSLDTSRQINNALRSQLETQKSFAFTDFSGRPVEHEGGIPDDLSVEVRVEHTVSVQRDPAALDREDYRRPRVMWDPRIA